MQWYMMVYESGQDLVEMFRERRTINEITDSLID